MQEPGAWVLGHRAYSTVHADGYQVQCTCGYVSFTFRAHEQACLSLALHLQSEVRSGAPVIRGDDGLAGVREPRRPLPPYGHGTAELDIA